MITIEVTDETPLILTEQGVNPAGLFFAQDVLPDTTDVGDWVLGISAAGTWRLIVTDVRDAHVYVEIV